MLKGAFRSKFGTQIYMIDLLRMTEPKKYLRRFSKL